MSSVEKASNVLGDSKGGLVTTPFLDNKASTKDVEEGTAELSDTPFLEKKSLTKDIDKCTDELADMKMSLVIICRKGSDKF